MNRIFLTFLSVIVLLYACYPVGYRHKPPTFDDITGCWEGLLPLMGIGYCRLDIKKNRTGTFLVILDEKDIEFYKFNSIQFKESGFHIGLRSIDDQDETLEFDGFILKDSMFLIFKDQNDNDQEFKIYLIKSNSFKKYRQLAIELIENQNDMTEQTGAREPSAALQAP